MIIFLLSIQDNKIKQYEININEDRRIFIREVYVGSK
jgi:hypothetical protein